MAYVSAFPLLNDGFVSLDLGGPIYLGYFCVLDVTVRRASILKLEIFPKKFTFYLPTRRLPGHWIFKLRRDYESLESIPSERTLPPKSSD